MTITVSRAGIEDTDIRPDSPEWRHWFETMPKGTKIYFTWLNDRFREERITLYRRQRYWEGQRRVSGKLRNATIKPSEVTYEALRQMGLRLTAYNWSDKFKWEKSGRGECQTSPDENLQAREIKKLKKEIEQLTADNDALKGRVSYLQGKIIQLQDAMEEWEYEAENHANNVRYDYLGIALEELMPLLHGLKI